ncbi:hypothetical protein CYMTET_40999 [Cymbomonas tetramitiformis]|uniref:Uncharacterized protein n=1 Tax=Cymbomonas tetramitiformis TaxID=36881 RepID=A0AAE0C6Y0_9CHLO|nr:hypothetical protein CYMTET_40999 [Cymbomonas tetramitiformis]
MLSPERFVAALEGSSETGAHELVAELNILARRAASGEKVLHDRSRISELSRFDAALRTCDARLMSLPFNRRGATTFGVAEAYESRGFTDEMIKVVLMQLTLRYVLMHSAASFSTNDALEKQTFASLSETRDAASYSSYREAADRVCSELCNRMNDQTSGRFFAAATIILCRYPLSEPTDAYHRLLRTMIVERLHHLYRDKLRLYVSVPATDAASNDLAAHARWRKGLVEWTVRQSKAPMPDKLYHLCTELTLLSRFVPTSWGASLAENTVERESVAFRRNPATNILAHCAPDRAADVRTQVQTIMTKMGETHRRRRNGNDDTEFDFELHWEFAIACLQYACLQECELDWMNKFYIDDAMNAEMAFARVREHRSRSGVPYAPALVRTADAWCFKRADRDEMHRLRENAATDGWSAVSSWCRIVLTEMNGLPCRAKNIRDVLLDIEECGKV